jgi:hypothetical protein
MKYLSFLSDSKDVVSIVNLACFRCSIFVLLVVTDCRCCCNSMMCQGSRMLRKKFCRNLSQLQTSGYQVQALSKSVSSVLGMANGCREVRVPNP